MKTHLLIGPGSKLGDLCDAVRPFPCLEVWFHPSNPEPRFVVRKDQKASFWGGGYRQEFDENLEAAISEFRQIVQCLRVGSLRKEEVAP